MFGNCFLDNPWKFAENLEPVIVIVHSKGIQNLCKLYLSYFFLLVFNMSARNVGFVSKDQMVFFAIQGTNCSLLLSCFTLVKLELISYSTWHRSHAGKEKTRYFLLQSLMQNLLNKFRFVVHNLFNEHKNKYNRCTSA